MTDKIEVTQADREAAARQITERGIYSPVVAKKVQSGRGDDLSLVQAFALHRLSSEQSTAREVAAITEDRDLWRQSEETASRQHDKRCAEVEQLRAEVAALRLALHEIDVEAGNTIPPDGKDAAFAALDRITRIINPFRIPLTGETK